MTSCDRQQTPCYGRHWCPGSNPPPRRYDKSTPTLSSYHNNSKNKVVKSEKHIPQQLQEYRRDSRFDGEIPANSRSTESQSFIDVLSSRAIARSTATVDQGRCERAERQAIQSQDQHRAPMVFARSAKRTCCQRRE